MLIWKAYTNRDFLRVIPFEDDSGAALDLTDYTITCEIRDIKDRDTVLATPLVEITGAAAGLTQLWVTKEENAAIGERRCILDFKPLRNDGFTPGTDPVKYNVYRSITE